MAHSIELLFDPETDAAIRRQWRTLADAGLPSLANHRSPTNRPHVTVSVSSHIDPAADEQLRDVGGLPMDCRVGAPLVFGGGRFTLVRSIIASADLLALHDAVDAATRPHSPDGPYEHTRPGRWTAHVTLARRLTGSELVVALGTIETTDLPGAFTGLRRWDGDARTEVQLT